jgi:hypothetical protein
MRLVVIKAREGVSALPMTRPLSYYDSHYEVITVANKRWNYYHVSRIKNYFKKRGM